MAGSRARDPRPGEEADEGEEGGGEEDDTGLGVDEDLDEEGRGEDPALGRMGSFGSLGVLFTWRRSARCVGCGSSKAMHQETEIPQIGVGKQVMKTLRKPLLWSALCVWEGPGLGWKRIVSGRTEKHQTVNTNITIGEMME